MTVSNRPLRVGSTLEMHVLCHDRESRPGFIDFATVLVSPSQPSAR
ncbi:hypothetical protein Pla52nx_006146 [Stieleria varia]